MADKSKMSCNKPTRSDRAGKKKMVKACEGGKEKLIQQLQERALRHVTSVEQLNQN